MMINVAAVVAIRFQDGSVGRMQIFERADGEALTKKQIQAEIDKTSETWAALGLAAVSWRSCEFEDFPTDLHDFRSAWTLDKKNKIVIDMEKAKEVTRQRLRTERGPLMAAKDIEALRALEAGSSVDVAAIAAEKQRLRDITKLPAIDAAKTPDDLRALSCASQAVDAKKNG